MNGFNLFRHIIEYDPHLTSKHEPTIPQLALLLIWMSCLFLYLARLPQSVLHFKKNNVVEPEKPAEDGVVAVKVESEKGGKVEESSKNVDEKRFSKVKPPPTLNEFLLHVIQLGIIMLYFYFTDYVKIFPRVKRTYSRDTFLFVLFLLFLIGTTFTVRGTVDKILNRDITEEWKGWMQVMFVWYHYFAAQEWYNWIRVYIAAYVWMTGFGNFSFFWVKKDYSLWRASKMLFRLNFLVLVICASVSNPYMLYYICPMHTYWFLSVYLFMAVGKSWNEHRLKMIAKFAIYAVCNSVIFDIPGMSERLFYPLWPILGFQAGKRTILHECSFRFGLDHWICFVGMLCAYNYPYFEAFLQRLENPASGRTKEILLKLAISVPILAVYTGWYALILRPLDKFTYNKFHPYLSFVPIVSYIWFRNLVPWLRTHYVHLFAELGKITLETYLAQLHVYLQSDAKELVSYIPNYPMLNFAFSTIVYLAISLLLFRLTSNLSAFLIPLDRKQVLQRAVYTVLALVLAFALASLCRLYLWHLVFYI